MTAKKSVVSGSLSASRNRSGIGHMKIFSLAGLMAIFGMMSGSLMAATTVRTTTYEYENGLLKKEIVEPGNSGLCLVTEYGLNDRGQRKAVTQRNCQGAAGEAAAASGLAVFETRTTALEFDDVVASQDARFPSKASTLSGVQGNVSENQSEVRGYNALGAVTKVQGADGRVTEWVYDSLGRKKFEKRPDGTGVQWTYQYCQEHAVAVADGTLSCLFSSAYGGNVVSVAGNSFPAPDVAYAVTATPVAFSTSNGVESWSVIGAYQRVYYDVLGREVRSEIQGDDSTGSSSKVYQDTRYSRPGPAGYVIAKSRPYYVLDTVSWTLYKYDILDRLTEVNAPDSNNGDRVVTTTKYDGLTTTVTDPLNHQTTHRSNAMGQVVETTDALQGKLRKGYDPQGNLVRVIGFVAQPALTADGRAVK